MRKSHCWREGQIAGWLPQPLGNEATYSFGAKQGDEMERGVTPKIATLERRLQSEPESLSLREQILWGYFEDETLHAHPRRIDHILWYVRCFPHNFLCRSPVVQVDPAISLEGYQTVEREWIRLLTKNPRDAEVARGAANFFCTNDLSRAREILHNIINGDPSQADIWMDLGRFSTDPKDRLRFFQEAQRRGSTQPNLLVWIARAAIETSDFTTAKAIGLELLALVDTARSEYGDKLDWKEKGREIWVRALDDTGDRSAASRLVKAISAHAYHKHWGHTVLGRVALHENSLRTALDHLRKSGEVVSDPRLSSYGPSFSLAKEACTNGAWSEVATYLKACESFWKDERLPVWRNKIESQELPDSWVADVQPITEPDRENIAALRKSQYKCEIYMILGRTKLTD